jgi:signal transduction histidine kinase
MTTIVAAAHALSKVASLRERERHLVASVQHTAAQQARLADWLQELLGARFGRTIAFNPESLDLEEVARDAVEAAQQLRPGYTVMVRSALHEPVQLDRRRAGEMLVDLLAVAFLRSTPGGQVDLTLGKDGAGIVIAVHDSGAPIPPEALPHVFEPVQGGGEDSAEIGLRLFIAQSIAFAHRGRMEVTSASGEGTTFTARIPQRL